MHRSAYMQFGSAQSALPISGLRGCRHKETLALRARLRGFAAPLELAKNK